MFIRMTKALLALGLMMVAGSSSAIYTIGGEGLTQNGYCGLVYNGQTYTGVMTQTITSCQQQMSSLLTPNSGYTTVQACHLCPQKFKIVPETAVKLPTGVVRDFFERTQVLRERFRIDEYERAQQELANSIWPESTP